MKINLKELLEFLSPFKKYFFEGIEIATTLECVNTREPEILPKLGLSLISTVLKQCTKC